MAKFGQLRQCEPHSNLLNLVQTPDSTFFQTKGLFSVNVKSNTMRNKRVFSTNISSASL